MTLTLTYIFTQYPYDRPTSDDCGTSGFLLGLQSEISWHPGFTLVKCCFPFLVAITHVYAH